MKTNSVVRFALLACLALCAAVASAQAVRTWVSGVGAVSSGGVSQVTVRDSLLSGNDPSGALTSAAIKVNGSAATIAIHGNSIVNNGVGLQAANGGTIRSTGRNHVAGNDVDGSPTVTVATF